MSNYAPIPPTAESSSDKKPELVRTLSATPQRLGAATSASSFAARNSRWTFSAALAAICLLGFVAWQADGVGSLASWACLGRATAAATAQGPGANGGGADPGALQAGYRVLATGDTKSFDPDAFAAPTPTLAPRQEMSYAPTTATDASFPTFSTSTYTDGNVSTFVYTTRPIVNPGGYTIGTLTGYVLLTMTPTSLPSSTANVSASAAASTDIVPTTASNDFAPTATADPNPELGQAACLSLPPEQRQKKKRDSIDFDDSHLMHKRGVNFALDDDANGARLRERQDVTC